LPVPQALSSKVLHNKEESNNGADFIAIPDKWSSMKSV